MSINHRETLRTSGIVSQDLETVERIYELAWRIRLTPLALVWIKELVINTKDKLLVFSCAESTVHVMCFQKWQSIKPNTK